MAAKRSDAERGTSHQRGYNATWQKFRRAYLQRNPLCVWICKDGKPCNLPATDVDHIQRITGPNDPRFYDESGLQPLCHRHHSAKTATEGRNASF